MIPLVANSSPYLVVVIGASAGGVDALQKFLKLLPKNFSLPLLITQHISPSADIQPQLIFGQCFSGPLLEAKDKMEIESGKVYFAPPDYHLLVEKDFTLSLCQDEPVQFARPSIDVLFESAAHAFGPTVCGILLTGANSDGALGLLAIHRHKGYTIVQNPKEAEFPTMPQSALELFTPDAILTLEQMTQKLMQFSQEGET